MKEKRTFALIFALLTILLVVLPFLVTFNEALTHLVEKFNLYVWVQERVVPVEVKMVGVLVRPLGIDYVAYKGGMAVNGTYARMTWNCIGWQSLFLLIITLVAGLKSGSFTFWSKIEAIIIALLGTFMINLLRLAFIVILFTISRPVYAIVYHDYLAAVVTIVWLFFFWWFSYSFILGEKQP